SIKKYKATSNGTRNISGLDFSEITTDSPEKTLLRPLVKPAGRNSQGRITTRHKGSGHRRQYRLIDFKRDKDGILGLVATIEYDTIRSAHIAFTHYADEEKTYTLAPKQIEVGQIIEFGEQADIKPVNVLTLESIPVGTTVHNVELK